MTEAEIAAFAARHGLDRLSPDDLARLRGFVPAVAQLGQAVPRTEAKEIAPWPPRPARAD